jgi:proteasome lid subunit RPN8/RPN11
MDYRLEASLDLGNTNVVHEALQYSLKHKNRETCGVFILESDGCTIKFLPFVNEDSYDVNHFISHDKRFYKYYLQKNILSLYHSHIEYNSNPSSLDLNVSESLSLPSFIFSIQDKSQYLYYPNSYKPKPLQKRIFIPYFQDCITFVKDFFQLELNIKFTNSIKNWARQGKDSNKFLIKNIENNFINIDFSCIKDYDIIVFKPTLDRVFHLGIYLGDNTMYHHPIYGYPKKELFLPEHLNKVYKVYRYKDL